MQGGGAGGGTFLRTEGPRSPVGRGRRAWECGSELSRHAASARSGGTPERPGPPGPGWGLRPGGERTPELRAGARGGLETGRRDRHLRAPLSQLRAGAPGGGSGGAGGHPLTFPGLSWTAAFPPALCLLGRPALPSCVPPGAGGAGGYASGRRGAAAPESLTGLRWQRAPLRSAPPAPRTQRGHTGCTGTARTACTHGMMRTRDARRRGAR